MGPTRNAPIGRGGSRSPAERMKAAALRILSHRSHTRAELRRKLRQRGHAGEGVEALLDRLAEIGYLDNAAAARSWVRRRLERRPMGRSSMEEELKRRGVPPPVLAAALEEAYGEEAELDMARRAARKRLRSLGGGGASRARERLLVFLKGRGFPARVCLRAAEELCEPRPGESGEADGDIRPFEVLGE